MGYEPRSVYEFGDKAPRREVARDWQPIETVPEGTMVLLCSMTATEARRWCFVDWIAGGTLCAHPTWTATHWRPLPAPPQVPKADGHG